MKQGVLVSGLGVGSTSFTDEKQRRAGGGRGCLKGYWKDRKGLCQDVK